MTHSAVSFLCGLALVPVLAIPAHALEAEADRDPVHLMGTWRGTSLCTDREAAPACNDETVVYEFTPGVLAGTVHWVADKVVNGARQTMGEMELSFDTSEGCWKAEFSSPRAKTVWRLTVKGDQLSGTGRLMPGGQTIRRMELHRGAATPKSAMGVRLGAW
jgi:hypothetical protein